MLYILLSRIRFRSHNYQVSLFFHSNHPYISVRRISYISHKRMNIMLMNVYVISHLFFHGKRGWCMVSVWSDLGGWIMKSNSGQPKINFFPVGLFLRSPVVRAHGHHLWSPSHWIQHVRARDRGKGQGETKKTKKEKTCEKEDKESAETRHTQRKHARDLKQGQERKRTRKREWERGTNRASERAQERST